MSKRGILDQVALTLSHIFSAPPYSLYLYIYLVTIKKVLTLATLLLGILFLLILPTFMIILDWRKGYTDFFVSNVEDRPKYLVATSLSYFGGFAISRILLNSLIAMYFLSYGVNTLLLMLLSLMRYKVSIHTAGIAGPTFLVCTLGLTHSLLYIILIPIA